MLGAKINLIVSKHYWTKEHSLKRVRDIEIANRQTETNNELNKIENHVLTNFEKTNSKILDKNWLKSVIEEYYNPKELTKVKIPNDLVNFIGYYIEHKEGEITKSSVTKYNVIKHKMQRLEEYRGHTIYINEIGEDFKDEFVNYYRLENYAQNTMQRELGIVKTFCKQAKRLGIETHTQLDDLKLKKEKSLPLYLDFDELNKIENLKDLPDYLDNARDWLIVSSFTGQRISDFMRFNSDMIRIEEGKSLLEFTQQKTKKLMTIPLHEKVTNVLDKRKGQFPRRISDQRYNDYIKQVCEKAELKSKIQGKIQKNISKEKDISKMRSVTGEFEKWELVTSHIGRRSFATNFYGKIPTNYLIYVTGHSSESMFLNYIGKSNKDMAMELIKYF
ncbi:phage integrase SAM-like domain-containing protein [Maribacter sp. SA7]|uniref:tyrosine-type recombinase/integrase n=1 Tax=Maribacter zhoushanensis TaxID=3030012 RepID=UPI0023EBAAEA|nr:phage integrase SAM-like domain-containing protein [Maribacter zhoushanensis]MDF4204019.1 phage integrase SAM-like domain-containing protein [Maribacter zhoushanensis]